MMMLATLQAQVAALEARVRALENEKRAPVPAEDTAAPIDRFRAKERAEMLAALEQTAWNRVEAARIVGMPRRTFYRRMEEYGLQSGDSRTGFTKKAKA